MDLSIATKTWDNLCVASINPLGKKETRYKMHASMDYTRHG